MTYTCGCLKPPFRYTGNVHVLLFRLSMERKNPNDDDSPVPFPAGTDAVNGRRKPKGSRRLRGHQDPAGCPRHDKRCKTCGSCCRLNAAYNPPIVNDRFIENKVCARCFVARYCSKLCQRADWGMHRPDCVPKAPIHEVVD